MSNEPREGQDPAPSNWRNHGMPWRASNDEALVAGLRAGLTVESLADVHGRTPRAILGRLSMMVPATDPEAEVPKGRPARVIWLRERLASDPDYDWNQVLDDTLDSGQRRWSDQEDALVREGWEQRTALPELAAALDVSEPVLVRRLILLGLATDLIDATDRLPTAPGSVMAARRQISLDARDTQLVVLVLTCEAELLHISLHTTDDEALVARDQVVAKYRATGRRMTIAWYLASRQVGHTPVVRASNLREGHITVQGSPAP